MAKGFVLLFLGSFLVFGFALAQGEDCPPPQPVPECPPSQAYTCDSGTQYQCESNECGAGVRTRTESYDCQDFYKPREATDLECPGIYECITDRTKVVGGPFYSEGQAIAGQQFKQCVSSSGWSSSYEFQCQGACYPAPEVQKLEETTLSPKNVFDAAGKVKLPLNVGWKNNVEQQLSFTGAACQISSFQYKVGQGAAIAASDEVSGSTHSTLIGENSCVLRPDSNYALEVRACSGGTCGAAGTLSFSTSAATQPLYPYDSDWQEEESAAADLPATLAWCPDTKAQSFRYQIYKEEVTQQNLLWEDIVPSSTTSYEDLDAQLLKKDITYFWRVAPCTSPNLSSCGIFSQLWSFIPGGIVLSPPQLSKPLFSSGQVPVVNIDDVLEWKGDPFTPFFYLLLNVETDDEPFTKSFVNTGGSLQFPFSLFWNLLEFETKYSWQVFACGNNQIYSCEAQSDIWEFKTTGEPPTQFTVTPQEPGGTRVALPATFDWNDVPGAASYVLRFGKEGNFNKIPRIQDSQIAIDYPRIAPNTGDPAAEFFWSVQTCADKASFRCGEWSALQSFVFAPLQAPTVLEPVSTQTEFFGKDTKFAWTKDFGSNYFRYQLTFLGPITPRETSPSCQTPHPVSEGFTETNSVSLRLRCLGKYEFNVQGCIDKACQAASPQTPQPLAFAVEEFTGGVGGFVPCDANNDNPATTGLDERDPCELKHLFLLARNLIDFALWKLSLVLVILMTAFTGFTMYTSFGGMEVAARTKSMWKTVGIGFLILLFSWLLLNLLLGFVGFQVTIFGKWYELVL
ncbi:MAG: hypothetical protein A2842_00810 [Candidatus Wildermuthbacteria bacterium RIFCSPHIGHO2_01_FULL_48_25]|uniref:Fibronectin type-III domain-containing protein n=1 Tax=Candidatus Wildermuthbacteria bacterium RIFCSPLOWO2_01_FULL_48_16 TaxID=1802461 RepID=A0A1G2RJS1_9BACT|nr:MAG: hypothetical protein A2842_00810 [Candidatus Wildermuthbacteria bacterium RIFCSPHIGHO2_01_FULL_48_25]OHA73093.1 MAG: hypothetical protein A3B24_01620 [Candidatus Wildermuthbacteria bacterium RIFCSPLOWO2_01_FULL_48_16]